MTYNVFGGTLNHTLLLIPEGRITLRAPNSDDSVMNSDIRCFTHYVIYT